MCPLRSPGVIPEVSFHPMGLVVIVEPRSALKDACGRLWHCRVGFKVTKGQSRLRSCCQKRGWGLGREREKTSPPRHFCLLLSCQCLLLVKRTGKCRSQTLSHNILEQSGKGWVLDRLENGGLETIIESESVKVLNERREKNI